MSAKHNPRTRGNFTHRVDEPYPTLREIMNNVSVMDDFVKYKEGRAVALECAFDSFNSHLNTGAEPARLRQYDLFDCHGDMR